MASVMDDLLATDPERLYTIDCAVQALLLPGTLSRDRCASTLWDRSNTMLTLAACYPRLMASKHEADVTLLDLLITLGVSADFRHACMSAMVFVNPDKMMDVASDAYLTYESECLPTPAPGHSTCFPTYQTDIMKELYRLCRTFYYDHDADDKLTAAYKIVANNYGYPLTTFRLLSTTVRGMMAAAHCPGLFDKLKIVFLAVLGKWPNLTPRLRSCVTVTLGLCGNVKANLRVKLMASLLRELWTAWGASTDLKDDNLLFLIPDLSSGNVYYTPEITLVCNIKQKCLGGLVGPRYGPDNDMIMNMLAYAVMESSIQSKCTDLPLTVMGKKKSKSTFKLSYVKVDGVPSNEDDVEQYMEVDKLTSTPATGYGFAVWNKSQVTLDYYTESTCPE